MFMRRLDEAQIDALKKDPLFKTKLLKDIKSGIIFPAIRKNEVHFYYKGSSLFLYSGKSFKYNIEYWYGNKTRGTGKATAGKLGITSFCDVYDDLKLRRDNYPENKKNPDSVGDRDLLEKLYRHTFANAHKSECIVLDIEMNTNIEGPEKCDMVLLHQKTADLLFVECKLFSDSKMYSQKRGGVEIVLHIKNARSKISAEKKEILTEYQNYVEICNELFYSSFPEPEALLPHTKLVVYSCNVGKYPIEKRKTLGTRIDEQLGNTVLWLYQNEKATLGEIFNKTNKYSDLPSQE